MHAIVNTLKLARPLDDQILHTIEDFNVRPYLAGPVTRSVGEVIVDLPRRLRRARARKGVLTPAARFATAPPPPSARSCSQGGLDPRGSLRDRSPAAFGALVLARGS